MNCKWVYLVLCVLGAGLPYSQFIPWVMENGLHVKCFVQQLFANRVGGFFGLDVPVSAVVLFRFVSLEGKRLQMGRLWLGLPLFLYLSGGNAGCKV